MFACECVCVALVAIAGRRFIHLVYLLLINKLAAPRGDTRRTYLAT